MYVEQVERGPIIVPKWNFGGRLKAASTNWVFHHDCESLLVIKTRLGDVKQVEIQYKAYSSAGGVTEGALNPV